jgi:hypothetical protein
VYSHRPTFNVSYTHIGSIYTYKLIKAHKKHDNAKVHTPRPFKLPRQHITKKKQLYEFLAFFVRVMYSENRKFLNFIILIPPRDLFKLHKSSLCSYDFLPSQLLSPHSFRNTLLTFSDCCILHNSLRTMRQSYIHTTSFQLE